VLCHSLFEISSEFSIRTDFSWKKIENRRLPKTGRAKIKVNLGFSSKVLFRCVQKTNLFERKAQT
jgi:hypothetical protein